MGDGYKLHSQRAVDALSRCRIPQLVHSIKSRHLSTIALDFMLGGYCYTISRRDLLAYVGSQAMQDALKSFSALSQLRLGIMEDDSAYDEAWWEQALADALAPVSQRQIRTRAKVLTLSRPLAEQAKFGRSIWLNDDEEWPPRGWTLVDSHTYVNELEGLDLFSRMTREFLLIAASLLSKPLRRLCSCLPTNISCLHPLPCSPCSTAHPCGHHQSTQRHFAADSTGTSATSRR
ncbi:hypothetical protein FKP32DRAFT_1449316 [Trametes sanguinea]|nr:hypothetical protein FKP32DRAFT_1449316 [Trametes sanguinea]